MPFDITGAYTFILGMALAAARLTPVMILVPVFCFQYLKGPLRFAVVCALALIPGPAIGQVLAAQGDNLASILGLALKESMLGTLLGLLMYAPFWMFASVGALFDSQRGALSGGQLNPALGPDVTALGALFQEALIMLVVLGGGFSIVTQVIWDSYAVWPPTAWFPVLDAEGLAVLLEQLNQTLQHIMLYSAPFIGLLLLIEAALAIIGLYAQQLQVSSLAMPAKCMVGMAFFLIYWPTLKDLGTGQVQSLLDLKHLLGLLAKPPVVHP